VALGAIGIVTLSPAFSVREKVFIWELARNPADVTEGLLNVALFVPLGAALNLAGLSVRRTLLAGLALSTSIELLQLLVIPGRFGQLQDILANTIGAAIGALLIRLLAPRPPAR
jgi:glycopeptide antibiotics resistance protein